MRLHRTCAIAFLVSVVAAAGVATSAGLPSSRIATAAPADISITTYSSGNGVFALEIDPWSGEVWVATTGGVVIWDPRRGTHRRLTTRGGLADDFVVSVAIDAERHEAWFGTAGGLSRLDAAGKWTTFTTADGLGDDQVTSIAFDRARDSMWCATWGGGLSHRLSDGRWETFTTGDGYLGSDDVSDVAIDEATGDVWVATAGGGADRIDSAGNWTHYTAGDGPLASDAVNAIAIDPRSGDKWFATGSLSEGGVTRLDAQGEWHTFTAADDPLAPHGWVTEVAVDPLTGDTWIGTYFDGVFRLTADGHWTAFAPDVILRDSIQAIQVDASTGEVWFGAEHRGIGRRGTDGRWTSFATDNGPASNTVWALAVDDTTGDRWLGTIAGASRLDANGGWRTYTAADGLMSNWVFGVAVDPRSGDTWFGTSSGISVLGRDGMWTRLSDPIAQTYVNAVALDPRTGDKWFGTYKQGALRLDRSGHWTRFTTDDNLADDTVNAIAVDAARGDVWFATGNDMNQGGVSRRDADGRWTTFRRSGADGLGDPRVWDVAVDDRTGDVWFATSYGAFRLKADGQLALVSTLDGLVNNVVGSVRVNNATGDVWFGTSGGVGIRRADGSWDSITLADGLPNRVVGAIAFDAVRGETWLSTDAGVAVLTPRPAGSSCRDALPIGDSEERVAELTNAADVDVYALQVDRPLSTIQVTVIDPDDHFGVEIFRGCGENIGAGGRHIGAGGRHIGGAERALVNVAFQPDTYYIAVSAHGSPAASPLKYHMFVSVGQPDPQSTQTLVLTHEPRVAQLFGLEPDAPELAVWHTRLRALTDRRDVGGLLISDVQTGTDAAVEKAYGRWLDDTADVGRANAVARALQRWIGRVRAVLPGIRYVVLAGDDRVIPHLRLSIVDDRESDTGWVRESAYAADGEIDPESAVGTALQGDFTLTDDIYAASGAETWGDDQLVHVPELAVGRLVERPADMTAAIDGYFANDGVLEVRNALTAGYDFMQDALEQTDAVLERAGLAELQRTRLWGANLSVAALRQQLFGTRQDLSLLGVHATHRLFELPGRQPLRSDAVVAATADLSGTLALGLACHAGLNVPGNDHRFPLDFPEVWQRRGATWIGATGWAYGLDRFLGYQEELLADVVRRAVEQDGSRVGEALVEAKRAYFVSHDLNAMHVKTLAGTALYGLPMTRVRAGGAPSRLAETRAPAPMTHVATMSPAAQRSLARLSSDVWRLPGRPYTFDKADLERKDEPDGAYYTFSGSKPRAEAGEAVQPWSRLELGRAERDGLVLEPRGAVLVRAEYHDEPDFRPVIEPAGVLGSDRPLRAAAAANSEAPGWQPPVPIGFRRVNADSDRSPSRAMLLFTLGAYNAASRVERLYDVIVLDEYYSASPDRAGPEVLAYAALPDGTMLDIRLIARDPIGIDRAVVAYTAGDGAWHSAPLEVTKDGWMRVVVPLPESYLVQVVDRAGNVTRVDERGRVYRPCTGECGPDEAAVYLPVSWR